MDFENLIRFLMDRSDKTYINLNTEKEASDKFSLTIKDIDLISINEGLIPLRYKRNKNTFKNIDQKRLINSTVAVIGCGGLGGYVIEQLARAGVGRIKAVDFDLFEESNLNRQILSNIENIGCYKVDEAKKRMEKINPALDLIPINTVFNRENSLHILNGVDVVIDALDNNNTRILLIEMCNIFNIPIVYGSIGGWYGQISVIYPGDSGILSILQKNNNEGIEKEMGNPSFTAGVVASIQVSETIKLLLGMEITLKRKILILDLKDMNFMIMDV